MNLSCSACGKSFEAQRSTRRFCSQTCQKAAKRTGLEMAAKASFGPTSVRAFSSDPGGMVASAERQLRSADRLEDWRGEAALDLARQIEAAIPGTSSVATLHREYRAAMALALQGVGQPASALGRHRDDLAARRAGRTA